MSNLRLKAVPIFRIGDASKAMAFYLDHLGCALDWEHHYEPGAPIYMQVSRAGLVLQLSENERFNFGNIVYIDTHGIDQLRKELHGKTGTWSTPPVSQSPWNTRQLEIEDPFGNVLRFHEAS